MEKRDILGIPATPLPVGWPWPQTPSCPTPARSAPIVEAEPRKPPATRDAPASVSHIKPIVFSGDEKCRKILR